MVIFSIIGILLFFFFVPIYKTTVSAYAILPRANECVGMVEFAPGPTSPTVYASLSYVLDEYLSMGITTNGAFGLIYVPNYGWNTIQFPPIGFATTIMCS